MCEYIDNLFISSNLLNAVIGLSTKTGILLSIAHIKKGLWTLGYVQTKT
jgi:hypothetical protein